MHIDNIDDQETQTLLDSLAAFNVTQHVRIPTHNKGHTLDIIITITEDDPSQPTNTTAVVSMSHITSPWAQSSSHLPSKER